MATPITTRPATILPPIMSTDTLLAGDPANQTPLPFEQFPGPYKSGLDIIIPDHPLMRKSDSIVIRLQYVMNPNGTPVTGTPVEEYPSPVPPSTTSSGLPVQTPADTTHTIPYVSPFNHDPGYKVTYWVKDASGKVWGYGKPWYIFLWRK